MMKKAIILTLLIGLLNPICCCIGGASGFDIKMSTDHSCCDTPEKKANDSTDNCPYKSLDQIQNLRKIHLICRFCVNEV